MGIVMWADTAPNTQPVASPGRCTPFYLTNMTGLIYIEHDIIGKIDLQLINKSDRVIGGKMIPAPGYEKYKIKIQELSSDKIVADDSDFPFRIILEDSTLVDPEGGINLTDMIESPNDIYIEAYGVSKEVVRKIRS